VLYAVTELNSVDVVRYVVAQYTAYVFIVGCVCVCVAVAVAGVPVLVKFGNGTKHCS
jgi:hypothetical protein